MSSPPYDAVVIGSGAGGAASAYRLVLGGMRVALLEKGDHLPRDGSTLDAQRVVHEGAFLSREPWLDGAGRRLIPEEHFNVGGKTKWYGAALLRYAEREFLPDASHGCPGWPLTLRDLIPYYAEAEHLLGVRAFACEPDLARILARVTGAGRAWRSTSMPLALAADVAQHPQEAMRFDGFASVQGLKGEAEHPLLTRMLDNPLFNLVTNAQVDSLVGLEGVPEVMIGARLKDGREFRAAHVLLAAGALHSPRLLERYLRSAALTGLPAARNVGHNLKLHLLTAMVSVSSRRLTDVIRKTVLLTHESYPHSSVQPLGFDPELLASLLPRWVPRRLARAVGDRAYGFFLQTEDGSDARNRAYEVSAGTLPILDYDAARLPAASAEHRAVVRDWQLTLMKAGLISFTQRIGPQGTAHACGSLRCGYDPQQSVVDPEGCVHGMRGLYVVDGSVLPRSSRVNPSLTIYAWALRVGHLIAQQVARERARALPPDARVIRHA
jgi:choline dehydrogenase-like flavoprotein